MDHAPQKIPAVELLNLTKKFGDTTAVDGINFDIYRGEFFGLLGPNGAGKTTFVNMLVGLATPTAGRCLVLGDDIVGDYRSVHAHIGFVPEDADLDQELTVKENLEYHAGYFGASRGESKIRAEENLKTFDLWDKKDEKPHSLSSGMRRRLLLARAMATEPDILIADEPTAGLDVEYKKQIRKYIREVNREGLTVILITHQLEEAEELCGRVAIMDEGRVIGMGPPDDLVRRGKGDLVKIELSETINRIPERIIRDGYQAELMDDGKMLRIMASEGGKVAADVLNRIFREGMEAESIEIDKAGLEDVFTRLTGGS